MKRRKEKRLTYSQYLKYFAIKYGIVVLFLTLIGSNFNLSTRYGLSRFLGNFTGFFLIIATISYKRLNKKGRKKNAK